MLVCLSWLPFVLFVTLLAESEICTRGYSSYGIINHERTIHIPRCMIPIGGALSGRRLLTSKTDVLLSAQLSADVDTLKMVHGKVNNGRAKNLSDSFDRLLDLASSSSNNVSDLLLISTIGSSIANSSSLLVFDQLSSAVDESVSESVSISQAHLLSDQGRAISRAGVNVNELINDRNLDSHDSIDRGVSNTLSRRGAKLLKLAGVARFTGDATIQPSTLTDSILCFQLASFDGFAGPIGVLFNLTLSKSTTVGSFISPLDSSIYNRSYTIKGYVDVGSWFSNLPADADCPFSDLNCEDARSGSGVLSVGGFIFNYVNKCFGDRSYNVRPGDVPDWCLVDPLNSGLTRFSVWRWVSPSSKRWCYTGNVSSEADACLLSRCLWISSSCVELRGGAAVPCSSCLCNDTSSGVTSYRCGSVFGVSTERVILPSVRTISGSSRDVVFCSNLTSARSCLNDVDLRSPGATFVVGPSVLKEVSNLMWLYDYNSSLSLFVTFVLNTVKISRSLFKLSTFEPKIPDKMRRLLDVSGDSDNVVVASSCDFADITVGSVGLVSDVVTVPSLFLSSSQIMSWWKGFKPSRGWSEDNSCMIQNSVMCCVDNSSVNANLSSFVASIETISGSVANLTGVIQLMSDSISQLTNISSIVAADVGLLNVSIRNTSAMLVSSMNSINVSNSVSEAPRQTTNISSGISDFSIILSIIISIISLLVAIFSLLSLQAQKRAFSKILEKGVRIPRRVNTYDVQGVR